MTAQSRTITRSGRDITIEGDDTKPGFTVRMTDAARFPGATVTVEPNGERRYRIVDRYQDPDAKSIADIVERAAAHVVSLAAETERQAAVEASAAALEQRNTAALSAWFAAPFD